MPRPVPHLALALALSIACGAFLRGDGAPSGQVPAEPRSSPGAQGMSAEQALRGLIESLDAVRKGPVPLAEIARKLSADMEAARAELRSVRLEIESAREDGGRLSGDGLERLASLEAREEKILARLDAARVTLVLLTKKLPRPEALALLAGPAAQPARIADPATAERSRALHRDRVGPLIRSSCLRCHDARKRKGDLVLESIEEALAGGAQGPALVPGNAGASLLYLLVSGKKEPRMPPGKELSREEVESIREWIETGAAWTLEDEREF